MRNSHLKFLGLTGLILFILLLKAEPPAYAADSDNIALVFRGVARTLFSVVEIPRTIIENPGNAPFPLNIVTGTVAGTVKTVAGTVMGAFDIARGAAPYAKYAIFAL